MPPFTKRAIIDSFFYVASHKPFDKITVRDIVDDCGVNRNTFYYYFEDIYAVLEDIIHVELFHEDEGDDKSEYSRICRVFRYTAEHRVALQNAFASIGNDFIFRFFSPYLDVLLVDKMKECKEMQTKEQKDFQIDFYKRGLLGIYLEWVQKGCKKSPEEMATRLCEILSKIEK